MNQRLVYLTPLIIAVGLGFILYTAIGKDPTRLETARLNDPVPTFELTDLQDKDQMRSVSDLKGKVRLLNVWATWCPSCQAEHPYLIKLQQAGYSVVGLNYKDERQPALRWLRQLGNPYDFTIYDPQGNLGFDLGVYGAPETYVLDKNGVVRHRHVGEINDRVWNDSLRPLVEKLSSTSSSD